VACCFDEVVRPAARGGRGPRPCAGVLGEGGIFWGSRNGSAVWLLLYRMYKSLSVSFIYTLHGQPLLDLLSPSVEALLRERGQLCAPGWIIFGGTAKSSSLQPPGSFTPSHRVCAS